VGLGLSGQVERRPLGMVLRGCHPDGGQFLPERKPARRRAGWDLTLAAPKSVSLLAALTTVGRAEIAAAHSGAVDEVVEHFERRLLGLRRRGDAGVLRRVPGQGLVAAAFEHHVNGAGEPHLHTHLIVCNLGRDPVGRWSAISPEWWPQRASFSAIYQLGLRHHLGEQGLNLDWQMREDGFADVVGVPRAAVRFSSGRGRVVSADRARFAASPTGRTVGIRAAANAQTRRAAPVSTNPDRGANPGFGPVEATRIVHEAGGRTAGPAASTDQTDAAVAPAVRARLASQGSCFRQTDVLVALAACTPTGMSAGAAERWVDRFCTDAHPVPGAPGSTPRWTSTSALVADQVLLEMARRIAARRFPPVDREPVTRVGRHYPGIPLQALTTVQELVLNGRSLDILGSPAGQANLLAHARALEVASAIWRTSGQRAVMATSSEQAADRWRVLTSMDRYEGAGLAEVVVVDHADRRTTAELMTLLQDINRAGAKAVLIEGGTSARLTWRRSAALARIGDALGRLDPGPAPAWADLAPTVASPITPGMRIASYETSAQAVGHLLTTWADAWTGGDRVLLVGMGYAESDGLNQAARTVLLRRGCINGPGLPSGSRLFQAGDQVLTLRRLAPDLPGGTFLSVVAVDPRLGTALVARGSRLDTLDRTAVAHLGYGYAATPAIASRCNGPLMVLGPPDGMGAHRARVVAAALVAPTHGAVWDRAVWKTHQHDRNAGLTIG
jgi:conjugative relaxase-like TrwC/TraI family protein